uniref:Uncharacterized protein n=1 Tax=Meloidogyne hapla TaxID=6305 RepID=A0A1I8C0C7_MELHA
MKILIFLFLYFHVLDIEAAPKRKKPIENRKDWIAGLKLYEDFGSNFQEMYINLVYGKLNQKDQHGNQIFRVENKKLDSFYGENYAYIGCNICRNYSKTK